MDEVLEKLKAGARRFRSEVYTEKAAGYQLAASTPQKPHTLMVGCADSRFAPEVITSSEPGEVFVARNIGNMVPSYGETTGGVGAVIEYAVAALKVRHIVICGHSDCGAMKALLNPESTRQLPDVRCWLRHGEESLATADTLKDDQPSDRLRRLTEQNVLMQMAHLKTHPSVAEALAHNELTVSGWVYEIATGEVRIAEDNSREFVTVSS